MIATPDTTTLIGLRDKAMLALLLGADLRRSELANFRVADLQLVEAR